jgi:hypothetical protein
MCCDDHKDEKKNEKENKESDDDIIKEEIKTTTKKTITKEEIRTVTRLNKLRYQKSKNKEVKDKKIEDEKKIEGYKIESKKVIDNIMANKEVDDAVNFDCEIIFEDHCDVEQGKKNYCYDCHQQFTDKRSYERHLGTDKHRDCIGEERLEKKNKCEECKKEFASFDSYEKHMKSDVHKMSKEDYRKMKVEHGNNCIIIGDKGENVIYDIYDKCNDIFDLECIGYTGNAFDIIFKFKNEPKKLRGIQVKTLTYKERDETYNLKLCGKYESTTVFVGIHTEDKVFCLLRADDVKVKNISFSTKENTKSKYKDFLYKPERFKQFKKDLIEISNRTTHIKNIKDYFSDSNLQEYESLERLKEECIKNDLTYERNKTNSNVIDCYINGYKIQHKSCSYERTKGSSFTCSIKKSGHDIDKDKQPYTDKDGLDFFVFEIINDEHKNNFIIVPIEKLIEKKVISTTDDDGNIIKKGNITIMIPHKNLWNTDHNWISAYVNRYDLLKKE